MSEQGLRRPRQVTVAGGIGIVGCLFLLIGVFDTMAQTRTVDARDSVADFLSRPPGEGLGLSVAEVLDLWRVVLFIAAGLAATAFVLAIYVFQRHNGARIGFTVAAALLLLSMPAVGILPIVLAVAAVGLWSQPARDWFAGRAPQRPVEAAPTQRQVAPSAFEPPRFEPPESQEGVQGAAQPPSYPQPYGQPYGQPQNQPQTQQTQTPPPPQFQAAWAPPAPPQQLTRPASVTWAAVLTWIFSGLTALAMAMVVVFVLVDRAGFEEELERQMASDPQIRNLGLSVDELVTFVVAVCAVIAVWSIASAVIAFFAYRRHVWARILLGASAAAAAALSLVAIIGIVPLVTLIPSVATVVLLFSRSASAWYAGRPAGSGPARREQPW